MTSAARRGIAFAELGRRVTSGLLGIVFSTSCTPAAPAPATRPEVPPSVSRVVPQASVEPASYQFTDVSGRFAVFEQAVVDLASERVAWFWSSDPYIVPVLTAKEHLLRQLFEGRRAVELWSLLDGSHGASFDGALVPHVAAPGRVALQRAEALDVIDTVSGSRAATLSATGQVVSVLPAQNGWRLLSRTEPRREQPLVLESVSGEPDRRMQTLALALPPAPFSLLDTAMWHTDPFLSVDVSGALSVNVIQRCVSCADTQQLALWRSRIDPQSGVGERWAEALFDREHSPDLIVPLFGPHVWQPPPPEVERVLQHMPTAADPGWVLSVAPDASRMITGTEERVCVWSLQPLERSWCEPRLYSSYDFFDSTHVWTSTRRDTRQELAVWDLTRRQLSVRSFPSDKKIVFGSAGWFLTYTSDLQGQANDIEVWNHTSATPQWSRQSCPAAPHFAGGAYVVCPKAMFDDEGALLLDASSGREVSGPSPPDASESCWLDVEPGVGAVISRQGQPLATVFDLGASEWAIVLPDGRFQGSADAPTYLAFYGPDARPLGRDQVEALRQPGAVQGVLSQLQQSLNGCSPE